MGTHRTLHVWRHSRALVLAVLRATDAPNHPRTRPVFDQLRRASVSVVANVVEGYGLGTRPQFHRHLRIALGSAVEVECLLELVSEMHYLAPNVLADLKPTVDAVIGTLRGILRKGRES